MKTQLLSLSIGTSILMSLSGLQAAEAVIKDPASTTLGVIRGADPGEGLDLDGKFIYALSMGASPNFEAKIRDATFKGLLTDEVPGAVLFAQHRIENWYTVDYGDSADDDRLEMATSSIRWSAAPESVRLNLANLKVGVHYKLQIMFGEQCCDRGFDVTIDEKLAVKDFNPGVLHERLASKSFEALITHTFLSSKTTLDIALEGATASSDYPDHNAIINALTLEEVGVAGDIDGDGLADTWEQQYFQNLAQGAAGDPDGDALTNAEELSAGTDPNKADSDSDGLTDREEVKTYKTNAARADTDGDGLSDGDEVKTHKTNPLLKDSDADRLADGAELNTFKTDPNKADTDGDSVGDFDEMRVMTDPMKSDSVSKTTSVGVIKGGDPGEGLDLQGKFIYAFSIGTENAAGTVGDANFTGETVAGVTVEQATSIIENWVKFTFGSTPNDTGLSVAIASIRHGGGGVRITLDNLTVGGTYKLQLLFAEGCCNRGLDAFVDGRQIVDEFAPYVYMGSNSVRTNAAVITHSFVSRATSVVVETAGATVTTPEYTDRNPIINAVTLEEVLPPTDTDKDGLQDEWERLSFGDLSQTGSGDKDGDPLTNSQEFTLGSDPNKSDGDGDGLSDGQEVNTTKTNPAKADSDSDGLSDGAEVNIYKSDPNKADTDDDTLSDGYEVAMGGDPSKPFETVTAGVTIAPFTGGDAGEGLDFDGSFVYAFSILPNTSAKGTVRDAVFTSENVPGVTVANATSTIVAWYRPAFGDTPNDNALEKIVGNIRHGGNGANIKLANLVAGRKYKLQLMFGEVCCSRGMDIFVDGKLIADEFAPYVIMDGINNLAKGAAVTYEFTAAKDVVVIQTIGSTVTTAEFTDRNPIINAVSLEDLTGGPVLPPVPIIRSVNRQNGFSVVFDSVSGRNYTLQYKEKLADPSWANVTSAAATGASTTLSDSTAGRIALPTGFYRIQAQ